MLKSFACAAEHKMFTARSMRLTTPLALLIASRVLISSASAASSRTITMAASASGKVSGTSDAPKVEDLIEDIKDFTEPAFKQERTIKTDVESKWQGEGVGARVRRSIGRAELRNLGKFQNPQLAIRHKPALTLAYTPIRRPLPHAG